MTVIHLGIATGIEDNPIRIGKIDSNVFNQNNFTIAQIDRIIGRIINIDIPNGDIVAFSQGNRFRTTPMVSSIIKIPPSRYSNISHILARKKAVI